MIFAKHVWRCEARQGICLEGGEEGGFRRAVGESGINGGVAGPLVSLTIAPLESPGRDRAGAGRLIFTQSGERTPTWYVISARFPTMPSRRRARALLE